MTAYNVQYLVARLAPDAGITIHLTPHGLRHSAITIGLDAGVSLRDTQDFARHADPETTRRYDPSRPQPACDLHHRPLPRRRHVSHRPAGQGPHCDVAGGPLETEQRQRVRVQRVIATPR